ncbi:MAG: glutathione S-transferase family protein [Methylovulum sp.]|uniref:glutathione S-transferase family protein n=1 Tax=Methylovulum sp. TaxID=1916980 RepID=UPI00260F76F4|nr:glutathione S-transferase family protein [Methylovulum sp.]MDD2723324.1 glutathione S-transferase family protein [Methylovulum sp.]MDD5125713.1 glutathione S-transferase family protein [Methylovulum sp.]
MKLYYFPLSPNSRRVIAVLHQLNLACELQAVDLIKGEQLQAEFLNLNPNHMIPTLVDGDFVLWESNAIMQYLCSKVPDNSLLPADPKLHADVSRWQFWQTAHFGRACGVFIFENILKGALNLGEPDAQELAKGADSFHRFAKILEDHLTGRKWLVGETFTLADFSVGSFLDLAQMAHYPLDGYVEISRWYKAIEQIPAWQSSAPAKFA